MCFLDFHYFLSSLEMFATVLLLSLVCVVAFNALSFYFQASSQRVI